MNTDYNRFYEFFLRYRCMPQISVDTEMKDLYSISSAPTVSSAFQYTTNTTVNMSIAFTREEFDRFVRDMSLLDETLMEGYIRNSNSVVQRAYEEYKILLKLSK